MSHDYSRSRGNSSDIPWLWVGAIAAILFLIVGIRYFFSGTTESNQSASLKITPDSNASIVFVSMSDSSKNRITNTGGQSLYTSDYSASVESGGAKAENTHTTIDMDERTEISYVSGTTDQDTIRLIKGRIFLKQKGNTTHLELKNFIVDIQEGDIIVAEQINQIYSTLYILGGAVNITTKVGEIQLSSGKKIMVSSSDLANPGLELTSLVGEIDNDIFNTPVLIKNNARNLFSPEKSGTGNMSATGSMSGSGGQEIKNITLVEPMDGSVAKSNNLGIRGTFNPQLIGRITINDTDALISPVNGTFSFSGFLLSGEINNIVYKAYTKEGTLLEKGVVTVFGSKNAQNAAKLIPNSSPITSKDFKITNPAANPHIMTDRSIKVQGTAPKDRVAYILVNDYRLQKYIPGSTTWYYFANMDAGTLKDGINGYTIQFFGNNNELLYTQIFTLIKESKNATISGEISQ